MVYDPVHDRIMYGFRGDNHLGSVPADTLSPIKRFTDKGMIMAGGTLLEIGVGVFVLDPINGVTLWINGQINSTVRYIEYWRTDDGGVTWTKHASPETAPAAN